MHTVGLQQTMPVPVAKENSSLSEFIPLTFFSFVCLCETGCRSVAQADL